MKKMVHPLLPETTQSLNSLFAPEDDLSVLLPSDTSTDGLAGHSFLPLATTTLDWKTCGKGIVMPDHGKARVEDGDMHLDLCGHIDQKQYLPFSGTLTHPTPTRGDDILELNVGGEHFTTLRSTLTQYPSSMLAVMFSGKYPLHADRRGRVFLDRSPSYFRFLLDWLRSGVPPTTPLSTSEQRLSWNVELDYFGLRDILQGSQEGNELIERCLTSLYTPSPSQDLRNYSLSINKRCASALAENTTASLLDENFDTGACAESPGILTAIFPNEVTLSGVTVAAYFKFPTRWRALGGGAHVEYWDGSAWREVGQLPKQLHKNLRKTYTLDWDPRSSTQWRVSHSGCLGLSHLIFH